MKMTKWMERKLSELGEITTGKTPPSSQPKFYGGNIPFVTPSDMDIRRTIDTTARYLTNAGALNVKSSFIDKPAICVSCIGSVGKAVLVDQPFVSNQQINSIVVYEYVERLFVYYNLLGRKDEIRLKASGTVQPIMNKSDFGRLTLRIPDQPTQKRIAKVFGSLDDKIELNRRMNETLEEMARALFRDWFIDFGPTRRQMDGATDPAAIMGHAFPDNKAAALAPLFPARLTEGGLPEGWEDRPLSSVVEQQKQVVKPDQHMNETFEHFSLPAFDKEKWPTLELGAEIKSNKTAIPSNAILVSKLNPRIERIWIPKDVGNHRQICSTEFLCFKPVNDFGLATVEALFRSDGMHEKMASMVTGTSNSHQRVPPKVLMQAEVLLPANIARLFENVTSPFLEKRQANRKENQTLSEIRDLLLPKLMSGEIQLKDAPMVQDTLDRQHIESSQLSTRKNPFLKPTK